MTMSAPALASGDYRAFADRFLSVQTMSGDEWTTLCVFHDDHNASMRFNVTKGVFFCHSCGAKGSIRKLEEKFGVSHRSPGVSMDVLYRTIDDLTRPAPCEARMDEAQLSRYQLPSKHWEDRGFTDDTVSKFQLGYDVIRDAMTIPMRTINGELIGVCRRYIDPDMINRYRYPKGFHKSENLFGSWLVHEMVDVPVVSLTEGAIDAMSVWQTGNPALAIYGSSLSSAQILQLREMGVRKINLFFDNDRAGRDITQKCLGWKKDDRSRLWERHKDTDLRRWFEVSAVDWSKARCTAKDANDLPRRTIVRMLASAVLIR